MNRVSRRLIAVLVLLAILFVVILSLFLCSYHNSRSRQHRIDSLVCTSVTDSRESFSDYLLSSSRESYLFGVSSFYLFKSLYPESNYYDNNFTAVISSAYGKLLFNENLDSNEVQALLDALEILAEDPSDIRGYTLLQIFADYSNYYD